MLIKYSEKVKGNSQNYNWAVRFDKDHGYLGISQYNEDGSHKERVLLSPAQVKALQEFLRANTASTRRGGTVAKKDKVAKPPRG